MNDGRQRAIFVYHRQLIRERECLARVEAWRPNTATIVRLHGLRIAKGQRGETFQ